MWDLLFMFCFIPAILIVWGILFDPPPKKKVYHQWDTHPDENRVLRNIIIFAFVLFGLLPLIVFCSM